MIAIVFAQVWDHRDHMGGGGWWWVMGIGWLVFLAAIVIVVLMLVRQLEHRSGGGTKSRPEELLAKRLARGEIDEEE